MNEAATTVLSPEECRVVPWFAISGDKNLRINYPLNTKSVIYDIGGYEGNWSAGIHKLYGCKIEIFEPAKEFVQRLRKRFDNIDQIDIHDFGLAGRTRKSKIYLDEASSSTLKKTASFESIKLVAADSVIPKSLIIDLMKINIEGGEYELLNHLIDTGLVNKIKDIQVQFHIFVPSAHQKRIAMQKRLSKTHHLTYSYPWIWENWRLTK